MNELKQVPITDDFETICGCAVRYALGRQSYMPSLVMGYITPLLPEFSNRQLSVLQKDLESYLTQDFSGCGEYNSYLNGTWWDFLEKVKAAYNGKNKDKTI